MSCRVLSRRSPPRCTRIDASQRCACITRSMPKVRVEGLDRTFVGLRGSACFVSTPGGRAADGLRQSRSRGRGVRPGPPAGRSCRSTRTGRVAGSAARHRLGHRRGPHGNGSWSFRILRASPPFQRITAPGVSHPPAPQVPGASRTPSMMSFCSAARRMAAGRRAQCRKLNTGECERPHTSGGSGVQHSGGKKSTGARSLTSSCAVHTVVMVRDGCTGADRGTSLRASRGHTSLELRRTASACHARSETPLTTASQTAS